MARILLVDDEEGLRLLLGRQLTRAGHSVQVSCDGQEAAEALAQDRFDLIISDMKMPRLDGMGLLARARDLAPESEFIILTGHGNLENAVQAFKTGNLFDYLLKPLDDIAELDAVVQRAIERHTLRSDNQRLIEELRARVDELHLAQQQLARMADLDGLTDLLNHRAIHRKLGEHLDGSGDGPLAVLLLDMDNFKQYNDTYGHPAGDQILRLVAASASSCLPDGASLGRCGGDEFMAVLPGCTMEQAARVAAAIREAVSATPFVNPEGTALPLRLCCGIADTVETGRSPATLVAAADAALYESKRQGGDTVTLHFSCEDDSREDLGRTAYTVLEGLVTAIDHKDHYTKAHSEHMTSFALMLADAIGCSKETTDVVRVAGLLHDVGKIGVPDSILRKPGRLSAEEYEVMKNHVTISAAIIHGLPRLADILDAVANHHERWDGHGYPNGLAGDQIPLLGRMMAIADAFSAMTLDRPYRAGIPVAEALNVVEAEAGKQFDPTLAHVFVQSMRRRLQQSQTERKLAA